MGTILVKRPFWASRFRPLPYFDQTLRMRRVRSRKYCFSCAESMDAHPTLCSGCQEHIHADCALDGRCVPCSKKTQDSSVLFSPDFLFGPEDSESEIPYESLDEESDSLEVYEEPDEAGDDIMLEIVQEQLTSWTSSEEEDASLDGFFKSPELEAVKESLAGPPQDIKLEPEIDQIEEDDLAKVSVVVKSKPKPKPVMVEPLPIVEPPQRSIAFDIKKTQIGPNGEILTTTKSIKWQPVPTVSTNNQTAFKSKKKPAKKISNFAASPAPATRINDTPAPIAANQWLALAALNISNMQKAKGNGNGMFKQPVNLNSVATAAAALMANPAAMQALTELRKREMHKYVEKMTLHAKVKAAAQAAGGSAAPQAKKLKIVLKI